MTNEDGIKAVVYMKNNLRQLLKKEQMDSIKEESPKPKEVKGGMSSFPSYEDFMKNTQHMQKDHSYDEELIRRIVIILISMTTVKEIITDLFTIYKIDNPLNMLLKDKIKTLQSIDQVLIRMVSEDTEFLKAFAAAEVEIYKSEGKMNQNMMNAMMTAPQNFGETINNIFKMNPPSGKSFNVDQNPMQNFGQTMSDFEKSVIKMDPPSGKDKYTSGSDIKDDLKTIILGTLKELDDLDKDKFVEFKELYEALDKVVYLVTENGELKQNEFNEFFQISNMYAHLLHQFDEASYPSISQFRIILPIAILNDPYWWKCLLKEKVETK